MKQTDASTDQLWQLLSPHKPNRKKFGIMLLLILLATGLELIIPLYSRHLVDSISAQGIDHLVIIFLITLVLLAAISEGILAWYGGHLGESISYNLRYSLFGRLLNTKQSVLNHEHSAELSARVINDSMSVKTILAEDLIGLISGLISLLAVVTVMFVLDWRLTLVLVSCILVGMLLIIPLAMSMRGIGQAMQDAEADLIANTTEWFRSAKLIRAHNASGHILKQGEALLANSYTHAMRQARVMAMIGPISNLILMMSMVAILAFSAYWIANGSMTLGTVTAFLIYLFGLAFPIMAMGMFFSNLQRAAGAATRLKVLDDFEMESKGGEQEIERLESLQLNNLTFNHDGKKILDGVNLTLSQPGMAMILGHSGSGKSTLIQQLLGFYQRTHDQICVNGRPFADYSLHSIRAQMAWVDQEPRTFHASVRDNLTLGLDSQPCDAEIIDTLKQVGLSDWFGKINQDLDTQINEQQQQFSGGEKQRFAMARALLRRPQMMILDEPTSALDKNSEAALMTLIRELSRELQVIMVTHNTNLVKLEDRVLTMTDGQLKECASHNPSSKSA